LGRQATRIAQDGSTEVWARPLFDRTWAVGLFNRSVESVPVTVRWSDLGLVGRQPVRDLWQRKDIGRHRGGFTAPVPSHGALLLKVGWA
jgi:alpha-galactosidase